MRLVYEHLTDIPSNFTEVEYLEGTGTQYIDVPYIPKDTSGIRVVWSYANNNDAVIAGSRKSTSADNRWFIGHYSQGLYFGWNTLISTTETSVDTFYDCKLNLYNDRKAYINGEEKATISTTLTTTDMAQTKLFWVINAANKVVGKLKLCQITEGNKLIYDFVPCLDNNNVPCMYDKVEGKAYYNAGTGSFTYGRKIIPVEYLEGTGTQWINTGIFPANEMEFESKFTFTSLVSTNLTVIGSRDSTKRCQPIGAYNNKWSASIGGSYDANGSSVSANTSYVVKSIISNGQTITLTVNGNQASMCTSTTGLPNQELYIFGRNFYGNTDPVDSRINAKMYFMKIKAGNVPVRDFIPCKDENNVGFMFDRVTHTAYLNAGTGSFAYGKTLPKKKLRLIKESKRRLPKGFKEVEYIQSSGTQYIDLGITSKSSMRAKSKFNLAQVSAQAIFGSANAISNGVGVFFGTASTGAVYCNNTSNTISPPLTLVANTDYEFDMSLTAVSINGVNYTASTTSDNNYNMLLFARILAGSVDRNISGKIYYFKLYDNGVLVRDFIPCLDASNVPCMYDLVEQKAYYNAGTGSFTYGHTITPVEYLESTGTQYIDTGFKPNNNTKVVARFKMNETASSFKWLFLSRNQSVAGDGYGFGAVQNGYIDSEFNNRTSSSTDKLSSGVIYDIVKDKNVCKYNDKTLTNPNSTFTVNYNLPIFALNNVGTIESGTIPKANCYYFKIYDNGTLVRDFIPCKDENNVGYMFDKVTHSLYANAGTGAFVVGNEIKQDITRFIKDDIPNIYRKVSYLQSSGTQYIDTGYVPNNNTKIKFNIQLTSTSIDWAMITGRRSIIGTNTFLYMQFTNSQDFSNSALWFVIGLQGNTMALAYPNPLNEHVITISVPEQKIIVDGNTTSFSGSIQSGNNYPLNVFASINANGSVSTGQPLKLYYYKIWDNGTLVRDYVPVVRKSDNKPGMYDRVTKQFFTNAGTGEFIIPT